MDNTSRKHGPKY